MGRWRFVKDVALADCAVDLEARDLDDLFETAAVALAELMVDPATVAVTLDRTIALEVAELDLLLYDWISELIFLNVQGVHLACGPRTPPRIWTFFCGGARRITLPGAGPGEPAVRRCS